MESGISEFLVGWWRARQLYPTALFDDDDGSPITSCINEKSQCEISFIHEDPAFAAGLLGKYFHLTSRNPVEEKMLS